MLPSKRQESAQSKESSSSNEGGGPRSTKVEIDISDMYARVEAIKLRQKYRLTKSGAFMTRWLKVVLACALFSGIVTPLEVSHLSSVPKMADRGMDALFIANRIIDCTYLVDIIVNCFVSYTDPKEKPPLCFWP